MLSDKLKSKIKEFDILTDFDETMVKEQGLYKQVFAYFSSLSFLNSIKFFKDSLRIYKNYRKDGDVKPFYSLLAGCPVEVIDKTAKKYTQNFGWNSWIGNMKIGIVSRNNHRVISEYLKIKEDLSEAEIVAANKPKIKNKIYTGEVELMVNNGNLVDFVKEKDYVCGDDEKNILQGSGVYSFKIGKGLYVCSKHKFF